MDTAGPARELVVDVSRSIMMRQEHRAGEKRSRRQVFEAIERATLRPLPDAAYVLAAFAKATINIDYHVEFEKHYYSVPYKLRAQIERQVELRDLDDGRGLPSR